MTKENIAKIKQLRELGYGYQKIGTTLSLSVSTVRSFCQRNNIGKNSPLSTGKCKNCGKPLHSLPHYKKKIFCSDSCRMKWWSEHHGSVQKKEENLSEYRCLECGAEFKDYTNKKRKFCSRECYIKHRYYGEASGNE